MRAFIAIELPENVKDFLVRIQNQLRNSGEDVKWVAPENIHLTLKFLGEIDEKKLDKIAFILEDIAKNINPFYVGIGSLGAFPKINIPRVIWVGIDKGDNQIKDIVRDLEEEIAKVGIPKEDRPYSCHITIGRIKSDLNRERLVQDLKTLAGNFGEGNIEFLSDSITLFKSTLTPRGPIYEALKKITLEII